MGRRYFTTLFISVVLLLWYRLDQKTIPSNLLKGSLLALGILSLLSSVENFYYPKLKKSKTKYVQEVSTLAPAGLIGDYWNSYVYSSTIPSQLISSPHDKSIYRNIALVEKLFTQPKLYLAKDMWLKTFPDTIRQFGRVLLKNGQEFHLGDCDFCQYRLDTNYYHFSYRAAIPTSIRLNEKLRKE